MLNIVFSGLCNAEDVSTPHWKGNIYMQSADINGSQKHYDSKLVDKVSVFLKEYVCKLACPSDTPLLETRLSTFLEN